jgi:Flp pilus assembly protein TadD
MAPAAPSSSRWLHGRAADLLLGCGLWYVLAFVALVFVGGDLRRGAGPMAVAFLVLALSTPHYGATLLRVYERRADRRAYRFFAVWATAAIAAAFALGVHVGWVGSLLITLYLTWSPWHYSGQNYGLAVLFLRRRGIALEPHVKRCVYASFLLSYVMTFLAVHSGAPAADYTPAPDAAGGYRFLSLGLPPALTTPLFAAAALGYVGCLIAGAGLLLRRARAVELAPVAALALTQALWFSAPILLRELHVETGLEPWSADGPYYFLWIAVAHAVQYVWITSYYARASGRWGGLPAYFARATGAGAIAWTLPALLFVPGLLGRLPYGAGLALLVAATVNLHHFVLDGAIWKLRDGRVARVLLRAAGPADPGPEAAVRRWPGRLVWVAAAASFLLMCDGVWERQVGVSRAAARGDVERMAHAVERLSWLGRESPSLRVDLARNYFARGDSSRAIEQLKAALAGEPGAEAWFLLGSIYKREERWALAVQAFAEAAALQPGQAGIQYELGLAFLRLARPAEARDAFARAADLEPGRRIYAVMRERAERALRESATPPHVGAGDPS